MIDYNDAEKALEFLKGSDVEFARRKALYEGLDDQKKTIEALAFINAKGSAAERSQCARASDEYQYHINALHEARLDFETMRNQRMTAALQIDMWRSVNSNQRKGNI